MIEKETYLPTSSNKENLIPSIFLNILSLNAVASLAVTLLNQGEDEGQSSARTPAHGT